MKRHRRRRGGRDSAPRPTPSTELLLKEFVSWLKGKGLPPEEAEEYLAVILDFQRRTGLSDLTTATREDIERYLDEMDQEDEKFRRFLAEVVEADRKLERADQDLEGTDSTIH